MALPNRPRIKIADDVPLPPAGVDPGDFYRDEYRKMELEMDELAFRAETFKVLTATLLRMLPGTGSKDPETKRRTWRKVLAMGAVHQAASMGMSVVKGVNPAPVEEGQPLRSPDPDYPLGEFYVIELNPLTGKEVEDAKKRTVPKGTIQLPPGAASESERLR